MRWLIATLILLSLLGLGATGALEATMLERTVLAQPVRRDPGSDTGWRFVGPASRWLDVPDGAYVTRGRNDIPAQVDIDKMRSAVSFAPIQRTIQLGRVGALGVLGLSLLGIWLQKWIERQSMRREVEVTE